MESIKTDGGLHVTGDEHATGDYAVIAPLEQLFTGLHMGLPSLELSGTLAQHDVYVRIQTDLLVIGDSIMTDRHHASHGNYEDDDPQNQTGGIIPAFPLSGWLRHGMEQIVQGYDTTVCHPGEANANFMKDDVYRPSRRLPRGRPKTSGFRDHENRRSRTT